MEKSCTLCARILDISNFNIRRASNDGLSSSCKECRNKAKAKYRKLFKDKINATNKTPKYKIKNAVLEANKAAKRYGLTNIITEDELQPLIEALDTCKYCQIDLKHNNWSLDHILALSIGGTNTIINIQLICCICNASKGNKTHDEFLIYKGLK